MCACRVCDAYRLERMRVSVPDVRLHSEVRVYTCIRPYTLKYASVGMHIQKEKLLLMTYHLTYEGREKSQHT